MGSGASSNVEPIKIHHGEEKKEKPSLPGRPGSSGMCKSANHVSQPESRKMTIVEMLTTPDDQDDPMDIAEQQKGVDNSNEVGQAKQQILELEKQVSTLESQTLDYQEQITTLQEQLESMHTRSIVQSQQGNFTQTLEAKDQYIANLNEESAKHQADMAKLRSKCKKKIRHVNSQLAEAKHTFSLQVFELKDEISKLVEENKSLTEQLENTPTVNSSVTNMPERPPTSMGIRREENQTHLILELSSRISEQDVRLVQLENQLRDKDKLIHDLRSGTVLSSTSRSNKSKSSPKILNETGYDTNWGDELDCNLDPSKSVKNQHKQSTDLVSPQEPNLSASRKSKPRSPGSIVSPKSPRGHKSQSSPRTNVFSFASGPDPDAGDSEASAVNEMKAIAEEMKKLRRKKKKDSKQLKVSSEVKDCRESSGVSRDSGVISVETDLDSQKRLLDSVSSATSTISALSYEDDYNDTVTRTPHGNSPQRAGSAGSRVSALSDLGSDDDDMEWTDENKNLPKELDAANIRRISAAKARRKKEQSEYEYIDSLLQSCDDELSKVSSRSNTSTMSVTGKPPRPIKSKLRSPSSSFE